MDEKKYCLMLAFTITLFIGSFYFFLSSLNNVAPFLIFVFFVNYFLALKMYKIYNPLNSKKINPTKGLIFSNKVSVILLIVYFIIAIIFKNMILDTEKDILLQLLIGHLIFGGILLLVIIVLTVFIDNKYYKSKKRDSILAMSIGATVMLILYFGLGILIFYVIGVGAALSSF